MNIVKKVKELNLPPNSHVVVGGSTLVIVGLAEKDNDVDLTVSEEVYEKYLRQGWKQEKYKDIIVLKNGFYDMGTKFYKWGVKDLLKDAIWVDGVPFMSLEKLLEWKKHIRREVDIPHIKLIEDYLAQIEK